MTDCTGISFLRSWKNGPRHVYITKSIILSFEYLIDWVYVFQFLDPKEDQKGPKDQYDVKQIDRETLLETVLLPRNEIKEYAINLEKHKYQIRQNDILIFEIDTKMMDFYDVPEPAVDIKVFVED